MSFSTVCRAVHLLYRAWLIRHAPHAGISPFKQRAFAGAFTGYLFNGYRRIIAQTPYFVIPFATGQRRTLGLQRAIADATTAHAGYAVYSWAAKKSAYYNSKEVGRVAGLWAYDAGLTAFFSAGPPRHGSWGRSLICSSRCDHIHASNPPAFRAIQIRLHA